MWYINYHSSIIILGIANSGTYEIYDIDDIIRTMITGIDNIQGSPTFLYGGPNARFNETVKREKSS